VISNMDVVSPSPTPIASSTRNHMRCVNISSKCTRTIESMLDLIVDVGKHRDEVLGKAMLQDLDMPQILENRQAESVLALKDLEQDVSSSIEVDSSNNACHLRRDVKRHDVVRQLVQLLHELRARNQDCTSYNQNSRRLVTWRHDLPSHELKSATLKMPPRYWIRQRQSPSTTARRTTCIPSRTPPSSSLAHPADNGRRRDSSVRGR
jgi:hypothetical protein